MSKRTGKFYALSTYLWTKNSSFMHQVTSFPRSKINVSFATLQYCKVASSIVPLCIFPLFASFQSESHIFFQSLLQSWIFFVIPNIPPQSFHLLSFALPQLQLLYDSFLISIPFLFLSLRVLITPNMYWELYLLFVAERCLQSTRSIANFCNWENERRLQIFIAILAFEKSLGRKYLTLFCDFKDLPAKKE